MTGQDAVKSAQVFLERLDFSGIVLTKMDGDAKGGAALSIRAVTGKPIKFLTSGEKLDNLEMFHPDRMASRILGMGDVVTLVEKAKEAVDEKKAEKLERKIRKQAFTLEDFYDQLQQVKRMGSVQQIASLLPGIGQRISGMQMDETAMVKIEAIINSMTIEERQRPGVINGSRRKRIALGSGTGVQDVNRLLKQFQMMQKMVKQMSRFGSNSIKGQFPTGF
jgi:signal recognition particle subunit SRP54